MAKTRLPILYKKTSSGKIQQWEIWVEGSTIKTAAGFVGMKMKPSSDTIREGKNIGRANETTPEEQAIAEARSKHEKKMKLGFVPTLEAAESGEVSEAVGGGYFPQLARTKLFNDADSPDRKKIKFPAYVQPKLNGLRSPLEGGKFYSRTRRSFPAVKHLEKELKRLGIDDISMDGELYIHEYGHEFEQIVSAIKKNSSENPLTQRVQYHVFDLPLEGVNFSERLEALRQLDKTYFRNSKLLFMVPTKLVRDEEELMEAFDKFIRLGYEGAMVRNMDGGYEFDKRSYNIQKLKSVFDDEFRIVGVRNGKGVYQDKAIFMLEIDDKEGHRTFEAVLTGENIREFAAKVLKNPAKYIGQWMKVEFNTWTNANKVPLNPRGISIREAE